MICGLTAGYMNAAAAAIRFGKLSISTTLIRDPAAMKLNMAMDDRQPQNSGLIPQKTDQALMGP